MPETGEELIAQGQEGREVCRGGRRRRDRGSGTRRRAGAIAAKGAGEQGTADQEAGATQRQVRVRTGLACRRDEVGCRAQGARTVVEGDGDQRLDAAHAGDRVEKRRRADRLRGDVEARVVEGRIVETAAAGRVRRRRLPDAPPDSGNGPRGPEVGVRQQLGVLPCQRDPVEGAGDTGGAVLQRGEGRFREAGLPEAAAGPHPLQHLGEQSGGGTRPPQGGGQRRPCRRRKGACHGSGSGRAWYGDGGRACHGGSGWA